MREEMTGEAEKILKEAGLAGQGEKKHSTEETIRILYEWLENHISYDMEAYEDSAAHQYEKAGETYEYAHNAWGILTKRKGMCQGYSDAFLLLCHMAGVEAAAVTGSINQSIPHVWNAVCLEGNWYYVDATNNKRNTGAPPGLYLAGEKQAEENHYVREGKGEFDSGSEIVIARQNFK